MLSSPPEAPLAPGLYIVAGPIGNLEDLTMRAIRILRSADLIACEDTRVTARLLKAAGSRRPMMAWHDHSPPERTAELLARMADQAVALVTDAGTPGVSDPGFVLVRSAIEAGVPITTVPGPSAPMAALTLSGLPMETFYMAGFLPRSDNGRRAVARLVGHLPTTLIFFETGPRLGASLAVLADELADRPAAVARELTKRHEEVIRAPLFELARRYAAGPAPRGELVLLVGPPAKAAEPADLDTALARALADMSPGQAAASVAAALGVPRAMAYARALELRAGKP